MKNLIIAAFILLPFFAVAQTNLASPQFETFASHGAIINKKFDKKTHLVAVDWVECNLIIDGVSMPFEIVSKQKTPSGEYWTKIATDCYLWLVQDDEGLRGVFNPITKTRLDVEIGDIWAEMKNNK